jgi:hypothetical protein
MVGVLASAPVLAQTEVGPSRFEIVVDGQFTGGVIGGQLQGEWSDVVPFAFISPQAQNGQLFSTFLGDPNTNSLLYVAIAPGAGEPVEDLYLMYDYLPRTNPNFAPGEFVADIQFPVTVDGEEVDITVQVRGGEIIAPAAVQSFFDVFVVDQNGQSVPGAAEVIEVAVGFGPSALSQIDHMLVELEVPLLISSEFAQQGNFFPPNGLNGIYSPEPAFWGASAANDAVDPPASAALFQILPTGSVLVTPTVPSAVIPEPSTLLLLASGLIGLGVYSWKRRRA